MGKRVTQALLMALVLLFGVFYGVSVTREGLGHVYGPLAEDGGTRGEWHKSGAGSGGGLRGTDGWPGSEAGSDAWQREPDGREGPGLPERGRADRARIWQAFFGDGADDAGEREAVRRTGLSPGARIAGKAGDLLAAAADGLIRLIVRLGEAVLS